MTNYPLAPINTVLLPEFQDWTDKYGLTQDNAQQGTTGNGVLFTAHYVYGLVANGLMTDEEKSRLLSVFDSCVQPAGILMRTPDNGGGYQAHDDLVGLMSAEALMVPNKADRKITKKIYDYGKSANAHGIDPTEPDPKKIAMHKWAYPLLKVLGLGKIWYNWNNVNPGTFHVSAWLQRRAEVIATMQMQQNRFYVNPVYWLWWAITMMSLVMKPNTEYRDGYTLRFHSALVCESFGPITAWICRKVRKVMVRDFGGFGQVLDAYFTPSKGHPLAQLCKDKY